MPKTHNISGALTTLDAVLTMLDELEKIGVEHHIYWTVNEDKTGVRFWALCNDFFYWGCADSEDVTLDTLPALRQAMADVEAAVTARYEHATWALLLYAARQRQLRPQGAAYPEHAGLTALFDAVGPKRAVDLANPHHHPEDGGEYAYEETCATQPKDGDA
jgi:hypothetical protein